MCQSNNNIGPGSRGSLVPWLGAWHGWDYFIYVSDRRGAVINLMLAPQTQGTARIRILLLNSTYLQVNSIWQQLLEITVTASDF